MGSASTLRPHCATVAASGWRACELGCGRLAARCRSGPGRAKGRRSAPLSRAIARNLASPTDPSPLDWEETTMQRSDLLGDEVSDSPLRLVIADDHEAARTGLRLALGPLGFRVAAEAADADSTIRAVLRERPDQCLIATHLPGGGIRAAAEIHARAPDVAIVMLDTAADETALFAALDAGAAGYLLKDIEPRALG